MNHTGVFLRIGLMQVYNDPFKVEANLREGNHVRIVVDTAYFFGDAVDINITTKNSFDYFPNLPCWAVDESHVTIKTDQHEDVLTNILPGHDNFGTKFNNGRRAIRYGRSRLSFKAQSHYTGASPYSLDMSTSKLLFL
ncbi:unnamed protein product [Rhizoctonia solani]|uniref:Uncharacterized protein n=1 Tax=Rhizoctonia solani TaxID=456999 RepID=A0A8H3DNP2_9AGAM|nr:unnamed protein product [Rhizoctonia solani]